MKANITAENAASVFCIGRQYPGQDMQERAIDFVASLGDNKKLEELLRQSNDEDIAEQLLILRGIARHTTLIEASLGSVHKSC